MVSTKILLSSLEELFDVGALVARLELVDDVGDELWAVGAGEPLVASVWNQSPVLDSITDSVSDISGLRRVAKVIDRTHPSCDRHLIN